LKLLKIKPIEKIRVVGYYANKDNINKGKAQELQDRKYYSK